MNLLPMKLITIVCEAYARDAVTKLLLEVGAQGWTLFPVEGHGSQGHRAADIPESANIQVEVVIKTEAAHILLERLDSECFERYAMIAFQSDVHVLRAQKF